MKPLNKHNNKMLLELSEVIDESLDLLKKADIHDTAQPASSELPPCLLDQCLELSQQHRSRVQEPVRTIHHFGLPVDSSLFSSLATLANTTVLKNIHPNNNSFKNNISCQTLVSKSTSLYDPIESSSEDNEYRINVFLTDLQLRVQRSNRLGQQILLCDNHILSQAGRNDSTDLLTLLKRQFNLRSIVVTSEPVESYSAYLEDVATNVRALSFDSYCQSILTFLQANPDLIVIRHEDFSVDPERVMGELCTALGMSACESFLMLRDVFDVDREYIKINLNTECIITSMHSEVYHDLCRLMGYEINKISHIVDDCVNSHDIHEKIDRYLFSDNLNRQDKFLLSNKLSEYFFQKKDNSMAQHFLACAQDYLSMDVEVSNKQKVLLSKVYIKYGCYAEALDIFIQKLISEKSLSNKESEILLNTYETLRANSKEKAEHGHEVLLNYLKKNVKKPTNNSQHNKVLIEIGTTRENLPEQGSTRKLAEYCKMAEINFITVDMDIHNTHVAQKTFSKMAANFQAINMKGEDFLRNYKGKIDFIFLDAYDFDHGSHSELRQSRYEKYLGGRINEQLCHKMHLDCAKSIVDKLSVNGVLCLDDTWLDENGLWCAKGTLAMPYLLENNFEVIEARNRSALLKRKSIN